MTVNLVAKTEPVVVDDDGKILTIGEFIAYVARVSNPSNQYNHLTASKLLKFLAKNKHWSPFEMANVVLEINTTRDIARQILRHRSFSFQEFSQRYADATQLGFSEAKEARLQDTKNRQNSLEVDNAELQVLWQAKQRAILAQVERSYQWALDNNIAKEVARVILPEGLTQSRMYMNGTLRSWIHYCDLRMANGTQKEHRIIATECWARILEVFPDLNELVMGQEGH